MSTSAARDISCARETSVMEPLDLQDEALREHIKDALAEHFNTDAIDMKSCIAEDERGDLLTLWKTRISWFSERGRQQQAALACSIVDALRTVPEGRLYVAVIFVQGACQTAWIDASGPTVLAVDAEAVQHFDEGIP